MRWSSAVSYTHLIETHLRSGEFAYSLDPPKTPSGEWPIVYFLDKSHEGYCQYYASAMGAMLRSLGIPLEEGRKEYALSGRKGIEVRADDLLDKALERVGEKAADAETATMLAAGAVRYYLAVSYTHLDVYKRQDQGAPRRTTGQATNLASRSEGAGRKRHLHRPAAALIGTGTSYTYAVGRVTFPTLGQPTMVGKSAHKLAARITGRGRSNQRCTWAGRHSLYGRTRRGQFPRGGWRGALDQRTLRPRPVHRRA